MSFTSSLAKESKKLANKAASQVANDLARERDKAFNKSSQSHSKKKKKSDDELVKLAAASIGFVSEAIHYRKEKKRIQQQQKSEEQHSSAPNQQDASPPASSLETQPSASYGEQMSEAIWELDAAERQATGEIAELEAPAPTVSAPALALIPPTPAPASAVAPAPAPAEFPTRASSAPASEVSKPSPTTTEAASESLPAKEKASKDLAKAFIKRHPITADPSTKCCSPMPLPVILPQRRPKTRTRGFVRAYAPALDNVGIDQATFLDFIDTFNKALQPNPWIEAINLAEMASAASSEPMMMLLGVAVEITVTAIMETQSRYNSNKFLDRVNAEFFVPRGLVCFVATWIPRDEENEDEDGGEIITTVGFDGKQAAIAAALGGSRSQNEPLSKRMKGAVMNKSFRTAEIQRLKDQVRGRMKPHSGAFDDFTHPAPLIFPALDEMAVAAAVAGEDGKPAKKPKAIDRAEKWMDEYMDRRAQAKRIYKDSEMPVAGLLQQPEFHSRYADPSHPAAGGDLVALLTGGKWQSGGLSSSDADCRDDNAVSTLKIGDLDRAETAKNGKKRENRENECQKKHEEETANAQKEGDDDEEEEKKAKKKRKEEKKRAAEEAKARKTKDKAKAKKKKRDESLSAGFTSLFQKDILYLVIMNVPSLDDPAAAEQAASSPVGVIELDSRQ